MYDYDVHEAFNHRLWFPKIYLYEQKHKIRIQADLWFLLQNLNYDGNWQWFVWKLLEWPHLGVDIQLVDNQDLHSAD